MGQPPLQGAEKKSIHGTCLSLLRLGRGFMGLTWCTSVWLAAGHLADGPGVGAAEGL